MTQLRADIAGMRDGCAAVRVELSLFRQKLIDLKRELSMRIVVLQRELRALHVEVIERISRIGESGSPRSG